MEKKIIEMVQNKQFEDLKTSVEKIVAEKIHTRIENKKKEILGNLRGTKDV